jgi:hypothetical protein
MAGAGVWTGGCQCGAVRYEVHGEPVVLYACHCMECQKQSASAFGLSMVVRKEDFALVVGEPRRWRRTAESGRTVTCHFCGDCGSRVYHNSSRGPEFVNVKAGSLDDTSWLRPAGHLWTKSAQPWVEIPADLPCFEGQPDDFAPLIERWRAMRRKSRE